MLKERRIDVLPMLQIFACLLWLILSLEPDPVSAADRRMSGARSIASNVSNAHGQTGEGVKGKYDDALHGDFSSISSRGTSNKNSRMTRRRSLWVRTPRRARYIHEAVLFP